MALYHFSAKIISRANGSSALAAAAYRSASRLHDQRLERHHDFSNKAGVVHSEVMLPDGALEEWTDQEKLWNAVEAAELRKDAQLAREVEFAIPRELDQAEGIRLAREFVSREFVARGMVADLNVHWDMGADGDPQLRADTFIQRWQVLERQRRLLLRDHEDSKAGKVADRMLGMAKSLERDPQVESILRNRKAELGLPAMQSRGIGQSLADMVGRGRSRGLGL